MNKGSLEKDILKKLSKGLKVNNHAIKFLNSLRN